MQTSNKRYFFLVLANVAVAMSLLSIYDFAVNMNSEYSFKTFMRFAGIFHLFFWSIYYFLRYQKLAAIDDKNKRLREG